MNPNNSRKSHKIFGFLILTLLFVLPAFHSLSQGNYQPAYIIDQNGDTVRGQISNKRWDRNPEEILFRRDSLAPSAKFTTAEIRGFQVAGEIFVKATVDVDSSSTILSDLSSRAAPEFRRLTVFLRVLFGGEKKLYAYKDKDTRVHFYIFENGHHVPLIFKTYMTDAGVLRNNTYKGQLGNYLTGCPATDASLKRLEYKETPLIKLFSKYYGCLGKPSGQATIRNETRIQAGVLAGVVFAKPVIEVPEIFDYLRNAKMQTESPSLVVGIFLDAKLLRSRGLSLTNDFFYSTYQASGQGVHKGSNGFGDSPVDIAWSFRYIKTAHQFKLAVYKGLFLSCGISPGIVIKRSMSAIQRNYFGGTTELTAVPNSFELGFLGGVGYDIRSFSLEGRFERSNGISGSPSVKIATQRIVLMVKYRILK